MMQANCQAIKDRLINVCILCPEHVDNINKSDHDILCFFGETRPDNRGGSKDKVALFMKHTFTFP